jgi:hypothetical protein
VIRKVRLRIDDLLAFGADDRIDRWEIRHGDAQSYARQYSSLLIPLEQYVPQNGSHIYDQKKGLRRLKGMREDGIRRSSY